MVAGWKRFIPHLRVLPEDLELNDDTQESSVNQDSSTEIEEQDKTVERVEVKGDADVQDLEKSSQSSEAPCKSPSNLESHPLGLQRDYPYELRDESGRKWWKYFDEYEYRLNKEYKKSRKWYEFLYPNHATQTKAERTLLYKLDVILAFYFLVLNWSKSLDTNNYTNAYVSGMQQDLHMKGNDYINTSTITNVGSIVLQLPFMYILPRFPAHIVLPVMDLGWTWFTFACYRANNLREFRGYRFIEFSFGAAYYPMSQYLLGTWYAPDEISSRVALFFAGQMLGGITSGLLQSRIFRSLNGTNGIAGWRWMFIIDSMAISLPTVIMGFFLIPGIPSKCYSLFLTDDEIRAARNRNKRTGITDGLDKRQLKPLWDRGIWKTVLFTSTFWVLVVFDTCSWNNMTAFSGSYTLWLNSNKSYSVEKVNNYSVLPACLGLAYVFFCAFGADLFRCKWGFMVFSQVMNTISCAILIKWDVSNSTKWYAFLTTYFSVAASPSLWSFINDFLRFNPQVKAVTWIAIYSISQSTYAWIPKLAWPTTDAPRFKRGYVVSIVFGTIYLLWTFVVLFFYKRNEKKHALGNGIILYNSDKGEEPPAWLETEMEERNGFYYLKE
ncbi:ZYRO0B07612p [Zygosaccharomyces rouxii]|uniref:ZYRO0B07612p n=1 Tax=Zygosaccharomyces rouxii (strain ATCC 2623 / CBS 732 / NBRC 1130 / NCYC 568 / NRRL Y-229) TaxID=559307 RepID=C5DRD6_ZYGRC|nr:uncharacterized protein ZYRO0B07612g [Zygosaccharomyces rouxii]KAH9200111.1 major facilitator superfamily domain-containing protein [Zygosaccharomyces rouxii]CAR26347.1 ZYRO0B07612p [Zygosaccharomyces rouxii]